MKLIVKVILYADTYGWLLCGYIYIHFELTALNSHGNPDVRNDLIELKN